MPRPILFLAFANNKEKPFLDLSEEDDAIYGLFQSMNDSAAYQVHRDQFTTTEELIHYLSEFKDLISIFHFGGHAANSSLFLEGSVGRQEGLIKLLAQQKHLKCVFLNGCHTIGFVEDLLAQGIPAIIATDRVINDKLAVNFATTFYGTLTKGASIENSFNTAKAAVQTIGSKSIEIRSEGGSTDIENQAGCPWGLYSLSAHGLSWKISNAQQDVANLPVNFWLRFGILIVLLFTIFTWSNRHVGVSSTAFLLTNGPLALIGISAFLLKQFEHLAPELSSFGKKVAWIFLKTPVLITMSVLVLVIGVFGTSIKMEHDQKFAPQMHLTDLLNNPFPALTINTNEATVSRLLAFSMPFSEKKKLHIENYHPVEINLTPILGKRLNVNELRIKSGLLLRLNLNEISLASRVKIVIDRPQEAQISIEGLEKAAALLGPIVAIDDIVREGWKDYLIQKNISSTQIIDKALQKWGNPDHLDKNLIFSPGEQLKLSMFINGSLFLQKNITINNQPLNDVLLEN